MEDDPSSKINHLLFILKKPPDLRKQKEVILLEEMTKDIVFFKQMVEEQQNNKVIREMCKHMEHEYFGPESKVFSIDSYGDKFYIILTGSVGVYIRPQGQQENHRSKSQDISPSKSANKLWEKAKIVKALLPSANNDKQIIKVKTLKAGDSFGELALINNRPRLATIISHDHTHLAVLRKQEFTQILKKLQEQKLLKEMGFFAKLPLFFNWNINLIRYIYLNSPLFQYRMGQRVYQQGQDIEYFYIVKMGDFQMERSDNEYLSIDEQQQMEDYAESEAFQINRTLTNKMKLQIPFKIGTLGFSSIIAMEDLLNSPPQYRFSCICVSAEGQLIAIQKKDFWNKIYQYSTSKIYVDKHSQTYNAYWDERIQQVQQEVNKNKQLIYNPTQLITSQKPAINKFLSSRLVFNKISNLQNKIDPQIYQSSERENNECMKKHLSSRTMRMNVEECNDFQLLNKSQLQKQRDEQEKQVNRKDQAEQDFKIFVAKAVQQQVQKKMTHRRNRTETSQNTNSTRLKSEAAETEQSQELTFRNQKRLKTLLPGSLIFTDRSPKRQASNSKERSSFLILQKKNQRIVKDILINGYIKHPQTQRENNIWNQNDTKRNQELQKMKHRTASQYVYFKPQPQLELEIFNFVKSKI